MLISEARPRWRTGEEERKRGKEKERGNCIELKGGEGEHTEGGSGGTSNKAE